MKIVILLSLICVVYTLDTPIIGILSQETYIVDKYFPDEEHDSFIAASYVKYLESAGARVIPIWIGQNEEYYKRVVTYTNGVLFPGGGTFFNESGGYAEAAGIIYRQALELNKEGTYYPVWGTCLGMQVLGFAAVGEDIRIDCSLRNKAVSLDFVEGFQDSRMFMDAPDSLLDILRFTNVTYNYHQYCLTEEILDKNGILDDWTILSTNIDDSGDKFISSFESKNYPIFGVQFHPEKKQFEFQNRIVPHNTEAVKVSQYFANFFVDECRKNSNAFPDDEMALNHLIYNYIPRYTGLQKASYEQVYVFDKEDFEKAQLI